MQALTTRDEISHRDPEHRACPACGAQNNASASFCWQCYRSLGTAAPQTPYWPAAPTPPEPLRSSEQRSSRAGLLVGLIAVTLGVVGVIAYLAFHRPAIAFPGTVVGLEPVSSTQTADVAETFRAEAETNGMDADMAFYGSGSTPVVFLMWIRVADTPGTVTDAFDAFAEGFASGFEGTVSDAGRRERVVGATTYVCAPVTGQGVTGGICMWQADDVIWVLLDVRPGVGIDDTLDAAATSFDA